jgi:hypothetical protein
MIQEADPTRVREVKIADLMAVAKACRQGNATHHHGQGGFIYPSKYFTSHGSMAYEKIVHKLEVRIQFRASVTGRCVVGWVVSDVSKECSLFIFRVKQCFCDCRTLRNEGTELLQNAGICSHKDTARSLLEALKSHTVRLLVPAIVWCALSGDNYAKYIVFVRDRNKW